MTRIRIFQGDITKVKADAIVNAANPSLLGGGGVDGAIHRAAGSELREECALLNGCATGEAKITKGYDLSAKFVIHTVGPIWGRHEGQESALLGACYTHSLELAQARNLRTIAFPAISTGAYGYPADKAADVATVAVRSFVEAHPEALDEIAFVLYDSESFRLYEELV